MILNIEQSMKLYKMIAPFVSEAKQKTDAIEFSSTIIDTIIKANEHDKFLHMSMLLTGKKVEELIQMDMNDFLGEFMDGLIENRILDLIDFYEAGLNG